MPDPSDNRPPSPVSLATFTLPAELSGASVPTIIEVVANVKHGEAGTPHQPQGSSLADVIAVLTDFNKNLPPTYTEPQRTRASLALKYAQALSDQLEGGIEGIIGGVLHLVLGAAAPATNTVPQPTPTPNNDDSETDRLRSMPGRV